MNNGVQYELGASHPVMGSSLTITLPSSLSKGSSAQITIEYSTTDKSTAIQWLPKEQTQGKLHPFLFSQCQPIYARSLLPVMGESLDLLKVLSI